MGGILQTRYGLETIDPSDFDEDSEQPEGEVVWEVIDYFSRDRWPLLKKVRLTRANWEFENHRKLKGLEENVRALKLLGIDLVDRWGSLWWKDGDAVVAEEMKEGEEDEDEMRVD